MTARAGSCTATPFLIKRPLLQAIDPARTRPAVLLIDEIDRADEEFEGYLLELLAEFQITIPELGTIRAAAPPLVILTSNRTREVHDALKRRCLYQWIEYPAFDKELAIVRARVPHASARLAAEVTALVQELRTAELYKLPGVSETLDWVAALAALDRRDARRRRPWKRRSAWRSSPRTTSTRFGATRSSASSREPCPGTPRRSADRIRG